MKNKTITKTELIERVYNNIDCQKYKVEQVVNELFDEMTRCMIEGEDICIKCFGSLTSKTRQQKHGINPKTQERMLYPERRCIKFKPSNNVRRALKAEAESNQKLNE